MTKIALLDGGLGQEITKRSSGAAHPLWSVKVMFDSPEIVVDVHTDFIKAGAKVICLNTYTATPERMGRHGLGERFEEAHEVALKLAGQAIAQAGQARADIQIAGCLPPIMASYIADVRKNYADSLATYRLLVAQQAAGVDLFLVETMSNIEEATAALDAAQESGKPVYIGLTLADDLSNNLRSGEALADAIAVLAPKAPHGILLNCSIPEAITQAMPILAQAGLPFGGYANGFTSIDKLQMGETVDVLKARTDLSPQAYADYVEQWIEHGATIVGGCCEVGPAHIQHLAKRLDKAGHDVTGLGLL